MNEGATSGKVLAVLICGLVLVGLLLVAISYPAYGAPFAATFALTGVWVFLRSRRQRRERER
ncbi:hypothetical protein MM440_16355 [Arsenicicoccus piscis]|uniref:Uncharacterized protein n=1 Tax=Arsenicicoccus piscis TaxID=673954 RepID=A0ABQ6HU27_9MICO|nr:hypothetical protein [Arsenicicoccus piscis]MCH8629302.1 hypothetical protein [Arsenicicoccus piscis]GMA19736.1 hypothetical protein GCM10025862_17570 [Arsenicicoccus piscis]GMA22031.1 hypothetical protein GCM10025862_40520 [Arsenicicoccus piscis]